MEPEDTFNQPIFSNEEREQLFPGFQKSQSSMHEDPPFDYGSFYQNQSHKTIFQQFGFLTDKNNNSFEKLSEHCKSINGLQGFVTLGERHKGSNMLDTTNNEEIGLMQFFDEPTDSSSALQKNIAYLRSVFTSINPDLSGNFENFLYIEETKKHKYFEEIKLNYFTMLKQCAKKKQSDLILQTILDFWIGCFRDMLSNIDKCSPIYTLNLFKKQKDNRFIEFEEDLPPSNIYQDETPIEKKKPWTQHELTRLQNLIEGKLSVSNSILQQLATQFNRSPVAIQVRLQKLQRERRQNSNDLENKLIQVLKAYPKGLMKQSIASKLKDQFKVTEQTFKKTIYPILSNSRNVLRIKGVYALKQLTCELQNLNNFKNRVIACLMETPSRRAELKTITRKYIDKFSSDEGINPEDSERIKTIEANISKTLHKYDVFDVSDSKTLYRYVERFETESVVSSSDWSETQLRKV